jgi:hypothetical protein
MNSLRASHIIKNALNKLDSKDFQNIELWKMEEAVNIAAPRFVRRRIPKKELDTQTVDDIQVLLKNARLAGSDKGIYFQSHKLPADYLDHSRVTPICSKGSCSGVRIKSDLLESANVDELLQDHNSQPSFDFEQTFHTIEGNRIKQYHNKNFEVEEVELSYYRAPQYITFPGTPQYNGGVGKDMTWEFKDDVAIQIITEAIKILAGNVKDGETLQIAAPDIN